ncbi:hypothetical protein [Amycolatopsis alba]|uniref:hypothetical protein n=1 Tax=Amycolatopsis alba TaxID=76020 RepID=UPI001178CAAC|nr:hypothetical protein [Amycolatopsis alba]
MPDLAMVASIAGAGTVPAGIWFVMRYSDRLAAAAATWLAALDRRAARKAALKTTTPAARKHALEVLGALTTAPAAAERSPAEHSNQVSGIDQVTSPSARSR